MQLIPAIDLKGGRCVRLCEGAPESAKTYGDDPAAIARQWEQQGARRLHVVNLDAAFTGDGTHLETARSIFSAVTVPVQYGGGLRSLVHIERVLDLGASRAVLGTIALQDPRMVEEAVKRWNDAIVVGIDARAGRVAVKGWIEQSDTPAVELARRMKGIGVERVIYTDISRDGTLAGVSLQQTAEIARESGLKVIASGGVATIEDVRALWELRGCGIEGVILGRALYEHALDFSGLLSQLEQW